MEEGEKTTLPLIGGGGKKESSDPSSEKTSFAAYIRRGGCEADGVVAAEADGVVAAKQTGWCSPRTRRRTPSSQARHRCAAGCCTQSSHENKNAAARS